MSAILASYRHDPAALAQVLSSMAAEAQAQVGAGMGVDVCVWVGGWGGSQLA